MENLYGLSGKLSLSSESEMFDRFKVLNVNKGNLFFPSSLLKVFFSSSKTVPSGVINKKSSGISVPFEFTLIQCILCKLFFEYFFNTINDPSYARHAAPRRMEALSCLSNKVEISVCCPDRSGDASKKKKKI